jgi:hypothetical protein
MFDFDQRTRPGFDRHGRAVSLYFLADSHIDSSTAIVRHPSSSSLPFNSSLNATTTTTTTTTTSSTPSSIRLVTSTGKSSPPTSLQFQIADKSPLSASSSSTTTTTPNNGPFATSKTYIFNPQTSSTTTVNKQSMLPNSATTASSSSLLTLIPPGTTSPKIQTLSSVTIASNNDLSGNGEINSKTSTISNQNQSVFLSKNRLTLVQPIISNVSSSSNNVNGKSNSTNNTMTQKLVIQQNNSSSTGNASFWSPQATAQATKICRLIRWWWTITIECCTSVRFVLSSLDRLVSIPPSTILPTGISSTSETRVSRQSLPCVVRWLVRTIRIEWFVNIERDIESDEKHSNAVRCPSIDRKWSLCSNTDETRQFECPFNVVTCRHRSLHEQLSRVSHDDSRLDRLLIECSRSFAFLFLEVSWSFFSIRDRKTSRSAVASSNDETRTAMHVLDVCLLAKMLSRPVQLIPTSISSAEAPPSSPHHPHHHHHSHPQITHVQTVKTDKYETNNAYPLSMHFGVSPATINETALGTLNVSHGHTLTNKTFESSGHQAFIHMQLLPSTSINESTHCTQPVQLTLPATHLYSSSPSSSSVLISTTQRSMDHNNNHQSTTTITTPIVREMHLEEKLNDSSTMKTGTARHVRRSIHRLFVVVSSHE